ncbi:MAG: hypothetical protein J6A28_04025 [Clostridia bacterium]|nr:hypothetical protein [Clostridia bacterium]
MDKTREENLKKLYAMMTSLYEDQSQEVDDAYLSKVEQALTLFADLFVQPQLEGIDVLPPFIFNRKIPNGLEYGAQKEEKVTINTGLLKDVDSYVTHYAVRKPLLFNVAEGEAAVEEQKYAGQFQSNEEKYAKNFIDKRNEFLTHLFGTVAHECQHLFQYRYIQYQTKAYNDDAKKSLYERVLGERAVETIRDYVSDGQSEVFDESMSVFALSEALDKDWREDLKWMIDNQHCFYEQSSHETDARKKEARIMIGFRKELMQVLKKEFKRKAEECLKSGQKVYSIAHEMNVLNGIYQFNNGFINQEINIYKSRGHFLDRMYKRAEKFTTEDVAIGLKNACEIAFQQENVYALAKSLKYGRFLKHIFDDAENYKKLCNILQKEGVDVALRAFENKPYKEDNETEI